MQRSKKQNKKTKGACFPPFHHRVRRRRLPPTPPLSVTGPHQIRRPWRIHSLHPVKFPVAVVATGSLVQSLAETTNYHVTLVFVVFVWEVGGSFFWGILGILSPSWTSQKRGKSPPYTEDGRIAEHALDVIIHSIFLLFCFVVNYPWDLLLVIGGMALPCRYY